MNIFCAPFSPTFLGQKIAKPNVIREKLLNLLLYKNRAYKMLMKLTPDDVTQARFDGFMSEIALGEYSQ